MEVIQLNTDILIIGGGTAGCYAALTIAENSNKNVLILEKANIKRSGCLAAGVNALNAYIVKGKTPKDYVEYASNDAEGIVRDDLLYSMSIKLNKITKKLEDLGLVILKDENGGYVSRGNRNIKINGENIKVILANAVNSLSNIKVLNNTYAFKYIVKGNTVYGAYALSVNEEKLYVINSKAVICSTGGASGLYRPNNPGFSRHKMWYSPFNVGSGYAMGIKAGAEFTTMEMRFIALRCKDTIAPTGTIAQGLNAPQVNSLGEDYGKKYGFKTYQRVYGTVEENKQGHGPCYLKTDCISKNEEKEILKAYLNMAPSQTIKWVQSNGPRAENVEIEGTEPYVVGGHTASGYWVDTKRETTIHGLFAAGDVAGGCPQKYVTGALVEGEISALSAIDYLNKNKLNFSLSNEDIKNTLYDVNKHFKDTGLIYSIDDIEEAMQNIMDKYAGGISTSYAYTENSLNIASEKIKKLQQLSEKLYAKDMDDLLKINEIKDRLVVCTVLIEHLKARKETRWNSFAENLDYPAKDKSYEKYINSRLVNDSIEIIYRDLVKGENVYEHKN